MSERKKKPRTLAQARAAQGEGPRGGKGAGHLKAPKLPRGRAPKGYVYDPRTIQGQRDQGRAEAAESIVDLIHLWKLQVRAGIAALDSAAATGQLGAGLDWADVNRAAENLADRAGFARKTEVELDAVIPVKLMRLDTYRSKDGTRHELPRYPEGDPRRPTD